MTNQLYLEDVREYLASIPLIKRTRQLSRLELLECWLRDTSKSSENFCLYLDIDLFFPRRASLNRLKPELKSVRIRNDIEITLVEPEEKLALGGSFDEIEDIAYGVGEYYSLSVVSQSNVRLLLYNIHKLSQVDRIVCAGLDYMARIRSCRAQALLNL